MSNATTPTPIQDKNGKHTTVHKKIADSATGTSRVAALGAPGVEKAEKRGAVKRGKYTQTRHLAESDVVELGVKDEDNNQNIYVNGEKIGYIVGEDEGQNRMIGGTNLAYPVGDRKVWRAYARGDQIADGVVAEKISGDGFSRTDVTYGVADRFMGARKSADKQRDYVDNGGIYFTKDFGGAWEVRGSTVRLPNDTETKIRISAGSLSTYAFITDSVNRGQRASVYFDDRSENTGVTFAFGNDAPNIDFSFGDDGSLVGTGHELTPAQRDFFNKVETFTEDVFEANERGL